MSSIPRRTARPSSTSTGIWCTKSPARRPSKACARPAARSGASVRSSPRRTTTRPQRAGNRATTASPTRSAANRSRRWTPTSQQYGAAAYFPFLSKRQGIVHVIGPENGATLPGMTVVCGDSHTSTHGAFGALAHGIGTSEVEHVHGDPDPAGQEGQQHAGPGRRRAAGRLRGQGHRAGHHRTYRHRRRHRLHDRVRRLGDPGPEHGRPHDGLQHGHRGRRACRPGGGRPEDHRLRQGPATGTDRRRMGPCRHLLADPAVGPRCQVRRRGRTRRIDHRAAGDLGHVARNGAGRRRTRAGSGQGKGRQQARRHRTRADLHGPASLARP